MKDKTVNIPIFETDIIKTVESLPRTPNEAGIIPVNLKRKLSYKNTHKTQYVSVPKLVKALETLKALGNRYYQFVPDYAQFKEKCKETDIDGFNFLFPEDCVVDDPDVQVSTEQSLQDSEESLTSAYAVDNEATDEEVEDQDDIEEEEYVKKDSIKKWQFDYNKSTCFSDNYPEINYKEDNSDSLSIAPGEGKRPTNILEETDWDIKTFPGLHPDGNNSLHSVRKVKLTEQDYFVQRLMNKDFRFAQNPAYVFAAAAYVEKKQINRNMGISFNRGTSRKNSNGDIVYTLEDPYNVLDNIKNTPRYWQKAKYELISKLEF